MQDVQTYLSSNEEEKGCGCITRGRSMQCTTFAYSNPEVPEYSIHNLSRIGQSAKKLEKWVDEGCFTLESIQEEKLNETQALQVQTYLSQKPYIDAKAIHEMLSGLEFPLYFFDYEGFVSAIPVFDGFGPYEQVPFQYSLHTMSEDGEIEHKEFLITEMEADLTKPLVERIRADIDTKGTVISWYSSYEKQRNTKLGELHPQYLGFFEDVNEKMFDLMTIFSKNLYVDAGFKGSSSIKKVLPVIAPDLSYKQLHISKGDQASERWEKMVTKRISTEEKEQIAKDLLEYCKMDTWAMVRIYQFLKALH
jgi:hypothetical protein